MSARWLVAVLALGIVGAMLAPTAAVASDPASSTLAVPSSPGETAPVTWTGTVGAPDSHLTSDCATGPGETHDFHELTLEVPELQALTYEVTFAITWEPASGDKDSNDLMFAIREGGADGDIVHQEDTASTTERATLVELPAGTYTVEVCAYNNLSPQDYTGSVTASTIDPRDQPEPAPSRGLEFAASVPADIQRDEGEPLIEIDGNGRIYTCGPTGVSQAEDYWQVSTDGGDQFHLLGEPPRGQQSLGGGGDCALALSPTENTEGFHHLAYAGLELVEFVTSVSDDGGHTLRSNPVSLTGPLDDRQWMVASSDTRVFLNFNRLDPRSLQVCTSNDGGFTFPFPDCTVVAPDPLFPGPMRAIPAEQNPHGDAPLIYFPWTDNDPNAVMLAVSTDDGQSWNSCRLTATKGQPGQSFAVADHDATGENIYVAYVDGDDFNAYLTTVPVANLADCDGGTEDKSAMHKADPGASDPVVVNRKGAPTAVFPWIVASGMPGRVAISFYGTPTVVAPDAPDDPETTEDDRTWNVYVNQSLNALDAEPDFSQVRATTHPNHYDQICLLGLGCAGSGDRSLVDFFAIDLNPANGELLVVYNRAHKRPSDTLGTVSTPLVVRQIAGPSNSGGIIDVPDREPIRDTSTDPAEDAIADYSSLYDEPMLNYVAAADLTRVEILPPIDPETGDPFTDGGFTVRLHLEDLSETALRQALQDAQSQSLIFMFRFVDGFRYESVQANYDPVRGFTFGHSEYGATVSECGSPPGGGPVEGNQCLTYYGATGIPGAVDQDAGTITMTAPLSLLEALDGLPAGPEEYPSEVPAEPGDRIYTAAAFVMANPASGDDQVQSFLVPLDNAPAMDFLIPAVDTGGGEGTGGDGAAAAPDSGGGGSMPATGGGFALLALLSLGGAVILRRR